VPRSQRIVFETAVASKRVVQCAGEIRRGVDERAVEIEDDVGSF
jgi:hypothetical protein